MHLVLCLHLGFLRAIGLRYLKSRGFKTVIMKNIKLFSIANTIGLIIVLALNILANALPLNGKTTGELSDAYPNLFVPAGFTFSIWGLIYLALITFIIYQIKQAFSKKNTQHHFITTIGWSFFLSCLANAGWIVAWHYEYVMLSLVIMFTILTFLLIIYQNLKIGLVGRVSSNEKIFVHLPFSIYLGWITVATIANITAVLVHFGWNGFGLSPEIWTVIMLLIGTFIGATMLQQRKDVAYSLVIIWAYFGIISKRMTIDLQIYNSITITAMLGIATLVIMIILKIKR